MMRRWLLWTLLLPLFCAGFGVGARAQGAPPCTFTVTTPFAFGQNVDLISDPTASQAYNRNETAGRITIKCNNIPTNSDLAAQKARVCISIPSDETNARVMNWKAPPPSASSLTSASNGKLSFDIYKDEGRLEAWPKALLNVPTRELANGETATIDFYGKINPYQGTASVGSYTGQFPVRFRVYLYSVGGTPPLCAGDGYGGTITRNVDVTATIKNMCTFTAPPADLIFPGQTIIKSTDVIKEQTTIKLTCTMDAPYWISLNGGDYNSGGNRRMKSDQGDYFIDYELYTTNDYSVVWGAIQNRNTVSGSGIGAKKDHDVWGKILPNSTSPRPGKYSDKIIVTVNF